MSELKKEEKTGLVLEGGGMRGLYTAGVLDVFMENGLDYFDGLIGVSAGAIHGCSYVSRQVGRSIRYYNKYRNDPRFMSIQSLITTGDIVGDEFCYHEIPEKLDPYDYEAFRESGMEFYVTVTNVVTGLPEYKLITDMLKEIDLVKASASLPFVSHMVRYKGEYLLDGGCADSIPVEAFRRMGFKKNVVVLTRHDGYRKGPASGAALNAMYHRYPRFVETMERRHLVYNRTLIRIRQLEAAGEIFVIRPSQPITVGRMENDMDKINAVYALGRSDALSCLKELKSWMEKIGR